jgi:non-specific serine/threonine protein kinase/serine/threonine-protein kinase
MNEADDFARIEDVFERAVALIPEERQALLDETLDGRADLRAEVEALLAAHDVMPPVEPDLPDSSLGVGSRVGPYRLVEKLGEGGMGEVFRAERVEGGFDQQAAVKVTRAMLYRADLARRFWLERQILASLAHPNIVAMLDGGATDEGQAYFVMEYVPGRPITDYCRERSLPLAQRLELMRIICGAVQYAHQRGIVHRDLKPPNILVEQDGVVKVLDFGVAKVLQDPTDESGTRTNLLPGPLTPNYASPEQLRGLSATTASDVYALGVLLYELTTGKRPYVTEGKTLDRVIELVLHEEPQRPSAAAAKDLPYAGSALRGDIDAIVAKAMSKEPGERYDSAGQLASDLSRALNREPVMARPASAAYVLRRMAARQKTAVAIGALALVAIIAASATAFWQRQAARREQARAELLFRDGRHLANALIFKVHDAVAKLPGSTEVRRTIVNDAVDYLERLEAQSGGDPTIRLELAAAFNQIGGILGDPQRPNLGDREGAGRQFERAKALAVSLLTPNASYEVVEVLVRAGNQLTSLYKAKGDQAAAVASARETVGYAARYVRDHPDDARGPKLRAGSNFYLAWSLPDTESVAVWEEALAYYEGELAKAPTAENRRNAALMAKYLASTLTDLGRDAKAEAHFVRALELDEQRLAAAPDDRQTMLDAAISYGQMGEFLQRSGQTKAAAERYARGVALRRRSVEADPKDVMAQGRLAWGLMRLGEAQRTLGATTEARTLFREAITVQEGVATVTGDLPAQLQLADLWFELAVLESGEGRSPVACEAYRQVQRILGAAKAPLSDYNSGLLRTAQTKIAGCG